MGNCVNDTRLKKGKEPNQQKQFKKEKKSLTRSPEMPEITIAEIFEDKKTAIQEKVEKKQEPTLFEVGDYQLDFKRPLGSGTFGGVYYGWHSQKKEPVAIKIIKKEYPNFTKSEK